MEADAQALGQSDKVDDLDKPKTRVEPRTIASDAASMKIAKKYELVKECLKFLLMTIMIIVGIVTIIGASNNRINRLEANLNMRIVESEYRTNQTIDRLGTSLNTRIDDTNKRIDDTNKLIDDTNKLIGVLIDRSKQDVSLDGSVRGDVESPVTSGIIP